MRKILLFLFVSTFWISASSQTYCTTGLYSSGCSSGDDLDGITLGSYSQSGTTCGTGGYADFTSTPIPLIHSSNYYIFTATTNYTFASEYVGVWVDWNDDGDFDDTDEFLLASTTAIGGSTPTYTDSILIDNTRPTGIHRMRVRLVYNTAQTSGSSCTSFNWGETHDYAIEVKPNFVGNCSNATNFKVDSITGYGAKVSWVPGAGNTSYYFEYGSTGFTPGTGTKLTGTYPGAQPVIVLSGLTPQTTYDYYFGEICNSGLDTSYFPSAQSFSTTVACPPPSSLSLVVVGDTFVNVQTGGTAGSFDYYWGPTGFTQGSPGTGIKTGGGTFTIDSLLYPGGTFDVYVRRNCGPNGSSVFIGPVTFTTNCTKKTLPYIENFNTNLGCMNPVNGGTSADTWEWEPAGGTTVFGDLDSTGFAIVNSDEYGSSAYMREILESPTIDASGLTGSLVLEFDQFYNWIGSDSAAVQVFDGGQWHTVLSMHQDYGGFSNPDHQYINVSQYANANFQVRFLYDDGNVWAWYWLIDNFSVREVQCAPSSGLVSTFIGPDSANFSWAAGSATKFLVEYGPTGFTPGTGTQQLITASTFGLPGLSAQTSYDFYVIDSCNTGFGDTLGPITITTSCLVQSLPYAEDFNIDLGCMSAINGGGNADTWEWEPAGGINVFGDLDGTGFAIANSDAHGNGVYMREMLTSPPIDAGSLPPTSALVVEFDQYYNWIGSDSASVQVFDGSQWHTILSMHQDYGAFSNPDYRIYDVTPYANANFQVRFLYDDGNSWAWWWMIDNFSVTESPCGIASNPDTLGVGVDTARLAWTSSGSNWNIMWGPAGFFQGTGSVTGSVIKNVGSNPYTLTNLVKSTCYDYYVQDTCLGIGSGPWAGPFTFCTKASCPAPSAITASVIGATSATISWTPGGSASDYNIEYGPAGFVRGTGMMMNTTSATANITGLTPATSYELYVRDSCGVGDVSLWESYSFTTACVVFPAPYTTDLSAATVGHYNGINDCWTIMSNNPGTTPDGGYSWEIRNTAQTTSSGTGPAGDNTMYPALGGTFITADVSGSSTVGPDSTLFISPLVNLGSVSSPYLEYYFHMYGSLMAELHVDIHNGSNWVRDVHVLNTAYQFATTDPYKDTTIDLSSYAGQTVQVRFRAITNGCCAGDIALDDISITGIPGCIPPANLAGTPILCDSIELSWNNAADSALVAYALSGMLPSAATLVVGDSITYITGTQPNTSYDFYVSNICDGDTSIPAGPVTVNTANAPDPVASFVYSAWLYDVTFDASTSTGNGNTYSWDFGDTTTGSGVNPVHTYTSGGTKTVTLTITNACGTFDTTIAIAGISLEEVAVGASVSVYPNPARELLQFEILMETEDAVNVKLLSMEGKVVVSKVYSPSRELKDQIKISDLPDGVYMLKVETSKGSLNRRVIKQ